jgi:CarD family transcriptional regulator
VTPQSLRPSLTPARPDAPQTVKLAVGDLVVYGNHGVGRIAARRKQQVLGEVEEVVVLELEELTVTLPLALARTQLRPLATDTELRGVREALRSDSALSPSNWLSRRTETVSKLSGGTPVELAQIVGEGAQRERLRRASGGKAQLSSSEREIFTKARRLLAHEIALALDINVAAADEWIDRHLARPA